MFERDCVAGKMFHTFLVNPNLPSFPPSPLTPLPIPTKHLTAPWFQAHISPYWDSHVFFLLFLQGTLTDLEEECQYSCNVCNKTFSEQRKLKRHQCIHSAEQQPLYCNVCNKSFSQQSHLKAHQRIHSGEWPVCCSICNKSFSRQSHLKAHMLIHSGERPYCCSVCNKSFTQQGNLNVHKRLHSGEQPFSCNVCNKSFSQ
jgi:uncharacterized Zn-finger protein